MSKKARFDEWRGVKAIDEEAYINSALLIGEYIGNVDSLNQIRTDLSSTESEQYKAFEEYGKRSMGVMLYCKLCVEEALEKVPDIGAKEKKLLTEINDILSNAYDSPRKNPVANVHNLLSRANELLEMDVGALSDKKQARELYFAFYTMLSILQIKLSNLSFAERGLVSTLGLGEVVNKLKTDVPVLVRTIEKKVKELNESLAEKDSTSRGTPKKEKTIQDHFNERFTRIFSGSGKESIKLAKLLVDVKEIREEITSIVDLRQEIKDINTKIEKIDGLLKVVEANDKKIMGRQYFLDLVGGSNENAFSFLMGTAKGETKTQLAGKIEELKNPSLYQNVSSTLLYGASWLTALSTVAYRAFTPQVVQDTVTAYTPSTQDSEAKTLLKQLTEEQLKDLRQQLEVKEKVLSGKTDHLSQKDSDLKKLIEKETSENLNRIAIAVQETGKVLTSYTELVTRVNRESDNLKPYRQLHEGISQFIHKNNGFLVKLSNWLAEHISMIFKSETAFMIDKARDLQRQINVFSENHKEVVNKTKDEIDKDPNLPDGMKNRLKGELDLNEKGHPKKEQKIHLTKKKLSELIDGTSPIFRLRLDLNTENIKESQPRELFRPFD